MPCHFNHCEEYYEKLSLNINNNNNNNNNKDIF